ncbi:MAG: L,D-transpeptidase [Anaerolineales bacterium]|nr:L,D-transpeptidase [Anaerolineales bacterium]
MTTPDPSSARQAIQNAQKALQAGDKRSARRWAERAASLAPGLEEPWLILAAVASPRASLAYLGRPVSYGCVVLGVSDARLLYDWAEIGTVVEIKR